MVDIDHAPAQPRACRHRPTCHRAAAAAAVACRSPIVHALARRQIGRESIRIRGRRTACREIRPKDGRFVDAGPRLRGTCEPRLLSIQDRVETFHGGHPWAHPHTECCLQHRLSIVRSTRLNPVHQRPPLLFTYTTTSPLETENVCTGLRSGYEKRAEWVRLSETLWWTAARTTLINPRGRPARSRGRQGDSCKRTMPEINGELVEAGSSQAKAKPYVAAPLPRC